MTDRYALLKKNPRLSEKVFGLEFDLLKSTLEKVQLLHEQKLAQNPISKRGLKADFSFENQFLLTIEYLKTYQTFEVLGFSYRICKSYANVCFHKVLGLLSEAIGLKNPKKLSFKTVKRTILDVSCQPVEGPIKNQEACYNSYKKTTLPKLKSL
jgi:hypothetical protein